MSNPIPVQCLRCTKFSLQDVSDEWRRQGFGNCAHREKFIVFGARRDRDCERFDAAEADIVAKRDSWLKGKESAAGGVAQVMEGQT